MGQRPAPSQSAVVGPPLYAAVELGFERNADFNGARMEGFGFWVTQQDGRRCSSAAAYLTSARGRDNLVVQPGARVGRVRIERGRAVVVEYRRIPATACASRPRAKSCSPAAPSTRRNWLLLSRIMPATNCAGTASSRSMTCGVGRNLHDHPSTHAPVFHCLQPLWL
ncbi:MAG: GMC family oxidoreductase [Xanthomonadales bacterium]|nr:GMC family oxidoreductase [Xanthomonadales bacterium]